MDDINTRGPLSLTRVMGLPAVDRRLVEDETGYHSISLEGRSFAVSDLIGNSGRSLYSRMGGVTDEVPATSGDWWLSSPKKVYSYLDGFADYMGSIFDTFLTDRSGRATELDHLSKLTFMSGGVAGYQISGWPVTSIHKPEQAEDSVFLSVIEREMRKFPSWNEYVRRSPLFRALTSDTKMLSPTTYTRGTNHSGPDWESSTSSLLAHCLTGLKMMSSGRYDPIMVREVWDMMGKMFPGGKPFGTQYARSGTAHKWQPSDGRLHLQPSSFTLRYSNEEKGLHGRKRAVIGIPTWMNIACLPLMLLMKGFMSAEHGYAIGKTVEVIHRTMDQRLRWFADDISAWDMSLSAELLDVVADMLNVIVGVPRALTELWRRVEDVPVGIGASRDYGFIRDNVGGISSGIITTSVMGSFLNRCRIITCLEKLQVPSRDIWVLGDDGLFGVDWTTSDMSFDSFDNIWSSVNATLGFISNVSRDVTFLMRFLGFSNDRSHRLEGPTKPEPLLSRAIQQWMCPEKRPKVGTAVEKISTFAKWLVVRSAIEAKTTAGDLSASQGNTILREMLRWVEPYSEVSLRLRSEDALSEMALALSEASGKMTDIMKFLGHYLREAEHSPTAAAVVAELKRGNLLSSVENANLLDLNDLMQQSDRLSLEQISNVWFTHLSRKEKTDEG